MGSYDAVYNEGGTETGSQTKEKHLSAVVAPQGLHGRIVDEPDSAAECGIKVKPDPTRPRLCGSLTGRSPRTDPGDRSGPRRTSSPQRFS